MQEKEVIKNVATNSIWLILESVIVMTISLVVGVISARFLGPDNYGLINRFIPFISLANSLCTFGMQSIITREISKSNSLEYELTVMGSAVGFRFFLSCIALILINSYALIVAKDENMSLLAISLIQSISLIFNVYEIFTYWFHARLKSKYLAISTIITSLVLGIWKIFLLVIKADVLMFACSTTLQSLLMFMLVFLFFKSNVKLKLKREQQVTKVLIKDSYHMLLTSLGVAIYGQIDKIMIGAQLGNKELGYYTAAYTLATIWYFIPQAISNSMRSVIFSSVNNETDYSKKTRLLYFITILLGMCAGIGFQIVGKFLIGILFGSEYLGAEKALYVLGWVGLFANVGTVKSIWLVGKGLQKYTKYFTIGGAVINVVMNYFMIRLLGIVGAAIATVVSQIFVQIVFPLFIKECRGAVFDMVKCFTAIKDFKNIKNYIKK